ncbi:OmpA family protein [Haliangium ochraceum]|uniref:OmpA/MotB domain protein n=2 Tax=Haliangium ochraceum TaxID=80816 RepID=D0LM77_HALO1|nr:OmpA family protein [Haliangium ochraceum]ACY16783.1 OmpA/MotB domain protein [Haliangium ochraceum DSM 14365]
MTTTPMARLLAGALLAALLALCPPPGGARSAHAQGAPAQGRFDIQFFRPSAAPRDLMVVQKSEVIGHLSPTVGMYMDVGVDPLVLFSVDSGQTVDAVSSRVQLTGLVGIGLYDWADLRLAVPFVPWQTGDNLFQLGTEGQVRSPAFGDIRVSGRVALPLFNRTGRYPTGPGLALAADINLPSGDPLAFTGDGEFTGGVTAIFDYRLDFGGLFPGSLIAVNTGLWLRPERQFAGVLLGDMASLGIATEVYVVQQLGISLIGEVYGYPRLNVLKNIASDFKDSAKSIPAEWLFGLRWQTQLGVTVTLGASIGAPCEFGVPSLRLVSGLTWQPLVSREQEEINRILFSRRADPDDDGLIGETDECPEESGPPENRGCPDTDADGDTIVDREDNCPTLPTDGRGKAGCPVAYVEGDQIIILDKVHFATDEDVILDDSKPVLEAVAQVLRTRPDIERVRIEGHTDVRASDAYNLDLSQRRVNSVMQFLIDSGVGAERLEAKGWGHTRPIIDDAHCDRPDEQLDAECTRLTSMNRRVEFHIRRWSE